MLPQPFFSQSVVVVALFQLVATPVYAGGSRPEIAVLPDCRAAAAWPSAERGVADADLDLDLALRACTAAMEADPLGHEWTALVARTLRLRGVRLGDEEATERARELATAAAQNGQPEAMVVLGELARDNAAGTPEPFDWFLRAAERGNAYAAMQVAIALGDGQGIEDNTVEAARWLVRMRDGGPDEWQSLFDVGAGVLLSKLLASLQSTREEIGTLYGSRANFKAVERLAEFNAIIEGPESENAREWRRLARLALNGMSEAERGLAHVELLLDELDVAREFNQRGAFLTATETALRVLSRAEATAAETAVTDVDVAGAARTTLKSIWLDAVFPMTMEMKNIGVFDGIVPAPRLRYMEVLSRRLAPFARENHDAEGFHILLGKARARQTAFDGDFDRAVALYEAVFRRETRHASAATAAGSAGSDAAEPENSGRDWFRQALHDAATLAGNDAMSPAERLLAIRAIVIQQDMEALVALHDATFPAIFTEESLDALFAPDFEDGLRFAPRTEGADEIFAVVAAADEEDVEPWETTVRLLLQDPAIPAAERLARVAAVLDNSGDSAFKEWRRIERILELASHPDDERTPEAVSEAADDLMLGFWTPSASFHLALALVEIFPELARSDSFNAHIRRLRGSIAVDASMVLLERMDATGRGRAAMEELAGMALAAKAFVLSEPAPRLDLVDSFDGLVDLFEGRASYSGTLAVSMLFDLLSLGVADAADIEPLLTLHRFFNGHFDHDDKQAVHQALERLTIRSKLAFEAAALSTMRAVAMSDFGAAARSAGEAAGLARLALGVDAAVAEDFRAWLESLEDVGVELPPDPADAGPALEGARAIAAQAQLELDAVARGSSTPFGDDFAFEDDDEERPLALLAVDARARLQAMRRVEGLRLGTSEISRAEFAEEEFRLGGNAAVALEIATSAADYLRTVGADDDGAARMERHGAQSALLIGDYDSAFAAYERALADMIRAGAAGRPQLRGLLLDIARLYATTGRAEAADSVVAAFPDAFPVVRKAGATFPVAAIDAAVADLSRQARSFPPPRTILQSTLGDLAAQLAELSLAEGGLALARSWTALVRTAAGIDPDASWDLVAQRLSARALAAGGELGEAIDVHRELVARATELGSASDRLTPLAAAGLRAELARLLRQSGDLPAAAAELERALAGLAETDGTENPLLASFHWEAGNIAAAGGNHAAALARYHDALRRVRDPASGLLRSAVWDPGWADRFTPQRALENFLDAAWRAGGSLGDSAITARAFEAAQLSALARAAGAVAEAAARQTASDTRVRSLLRERQDAARSLRSAHDMLADRIADATAIIGAGDPRLLRDRIAEIDAEIELLDPDLALSLRPRAANVVEIAKVLGHGEAVLKVHGGEHATHVFLVDREGLSWQRVEMSRQEIEKATAVLRLALDPRSAAMRSAAPLRLDLRPVFPFDVSHGLYRDLFQSLLEKGGKTPRHIFYEATGPLEALPLQVLLRRPPESSSDPAAALAGADWLVRHVAVTVIPSVGSLAMPSKGSGGDARRPFLGIGAPDFSAGLKAVVASAGPAAPAAFGELFRGGGADPVALARLAALPEARDELEAIGRVLGMEGSTILTGSEATQARLAVQPLASFRALAFATHGLLAGEMNMLAEPALVLTPGSVADPSDDGLLTMSEISRLELDADWVILSACNTAGADGRPGSGALSGLAQAFFYAGARRLIVSNWPVVSRAAVEITTATMEATASHPDWPASEALRQAMVSILERPGVKPFEVHPAYWAPFSLVARER